MGRSSKTNGFPGHSVAETSDFPLHFRARCARGTVVSKAATLFETAAKVD